MQSTINHYSTITIFLSVLFCIASLFSILLYYRPVSGRYALMLAVPGTIALVFSVTIAGGLALYYSGALLILAGLVRNSGLWTLLEGKFSIHKKPSY